jgi:hypothetical protein
MKNGLIIAGVGIVIIAGASFFYFSSGSLSPPPGPTPVPEPGGTTPGALTGQVTLSPICPVERIPPDPACAPKPYQTTVTVSRVNSAVPAVMTESDAQGMFRFTLPPGSYNVVAGGGNRLPTCAPVTATVQEGQTTTADISCDTGIR